jgi:hypothetical protein
MGFCRAKDAIIQNFRVLSFTDFIAASVGQA